MADTTKLKLDLASFVGAGPVLRNALKAAFLKVDGAVGEVLSGSKTHDFADLADGAQATTTVTVTGAALGDFVTGVSVSVDQTGTLLTGYVSATDTVTVVQSNESGGAVNLASATLRVLVRKA